MERTAKCKFCNNSFSFEGEEALPDSCPACRKKENPDVRVLVLTSFGEQDQVAAAIRAGAMGYLLKDSSPDDLFDSIRSVYRGNLSLPQHLALKLMQDLGQPQDTTPTGAALTERELDVLKEIARGRSNREIARELSIGTTTVRSHVSSLLSKLDLSNRTELALYAVEKGLIERPTSG